MITTGHLLVGGAIGVTASTVFSTYSPELAIWVVPLAFGLGVVSHHLLDFIPHTDAATFWPDESKMPWHGFTLVAIEGFAGVLATVVIFFLLHTNWAFAAGALGGVLPDLFDDIPLWKSRFQRSRLGGIWHRWHLRLHCADMAERWQMGLVIDAVAVVGGLWYLLNIV